MVVDRLGERGRSACIGGYACLALPFVAMLSVQVYARNRPQLLGLPFFYWYQLGWVLLTPALMLLAYILLLRPNRSGDGIEVRP